MIKQTLEPLVGSGKKKDGDISPANFASTLNLVLPPALKILSLFSATSKDYYFNKHYKYLKASSVALAEGNLQHLNQVFTDLATKSAKPIGSDDYIEFAKQPESNS